MSSKTRPDAVGRSLAELASAEGKDPLDLAIDLVLDDEGSTAAMVFMMSEADVLKVLTHPLVMVASDSWVVRTGEFAHPRFFATFPRVLSRYVRDLGALSLETAIMKMTSMPAQKFGLEGRGLLAPGCWADVVVLDLHAVRDRSTYERPGVPPEGIEYVLVNGTVVVEDGELTGERPGTVIVAP